MSSDSGLEIENDPEVLYSLFANHNPPPPQEVTPAI